jgi:hypothetical protein
LAGKNPEHHHPCLINSPLRRFQTAGSPDDPVQPAFHPGPAAIGPESPSLIFPFRTAPSPKPLSPEKSPSTQWTPLPGYACFLYAGGHPNQAVRALVSLLAESGFSLSRAGDLDPDGILIHQELAEIAGKEVTPLRMDAATFDTYLERGRQLEPSMLKRTALIREKTYPLPGMAELVRRTEETGMGWSRRL